MTQRIQQGGLQIADELFTLINNDIAPGTGIEPEHFWTALEQILNDLGPKNKALLAKRDQLQAQIDAWHRANGAGEAKAYKAFLTEIGYLVPEGEDFQITTENAEPEIATQAGPQLVVPIMNARFALNAANARWGSLYDALYGTDVISEADGAEKSGAYNPVRGDKVIAYGRNVLNDAIPLTESSHDAVIQYSVVNAQLQVHLIDGTTTLSDPTQFVGYQGDAENPDAILLTHNNLHIEIQIDRNHHIGKQDNAGVKDILMESALTTIMDCEDSVAAVDAEDKAIAYRNWLGLMKGDLQESLEKGGKTIVRKMNPDREYTAADGSAMTLKGRSMLFVRNVGHLMTNPAILDKDNNEIPEGIMDGMVTALASIHDLNGSGKLKNSSANSINIVKPKMHGPEEVAFTNELFDRIEDALNLPRNTLKVGIMDEERRTSVNLKECIRAAKERVVFINTGFLDRTGDEIHTSMRAGAMTPKGAMKEEDWITAYEDWNVETGLRCGLPGKAQIGKGMWAMPDLMSDMMEKKIAHPQSGATTAWVPSPTAATLHAIHYHQVDVAQRQAAIAERAGATLDAILHIPLQGAEGLDEQMIQRELDNNAQGILGYCLLYTSPSPRD